jgi:hypothetical protein
VIGIEVLRRHGEARAKGLLEYFDYVSRNDLFVSYVIINPQADRSKAWGDQEDELVAQLVDEDSGRDHRARRQDARHQHDHGERASRRQSPAAEAG